MDGVDHSVLDAYRTCEFGTITRDGTPIAWPTSPFRQKDGTVLITTSIAFAQKALNVQRDGRVSLLFSDPTASGLIDPVQIFVQGHAVCSEKPTTSPDGLEEFWSMLFFRQPSSRAYTLPVVRSLTGWYYTRLLITVTPMFAAERPAGSVAVPAAALPQDSPELTRSWRRAVEADLPGARELQGYSSCVLAARDVNGGIALARTVLQPSGGGYMCAGAPGSELAEGPASVLVHRHDEKLARLHFTVVRGRITRAGAGDWLLVPDRVISPAGRPLQTLRDCRAAAADYLAVRGLARPAVPWAQYRALARHAADRSSA